MKARQTFFVLLLASITLLLASCATTTIFPHPWQVSADTPHAKVYFMRPTLQRTRGIADADIKVELEQKPLLELSLGEYVLVNIKPGDTTIILRSLTHQPYQAMPGEAWRARQFVFEADQTYYILADFNQQEFRGMYYIPRAISASDAREMAQHMKPAGKLANAKPLYVAAPKPPAEPDYLFTDLYD